MYSVIVDFKIARKIKKVKSMGTISKEKMMKIEKITNNILSKYNVDLSKNPYVDIVSIVKQDSFKVEPRLMPIDTTGCLLVNDSSTNKERSIIVNKVFKNPDDEEDVVFKKSRFITAHEYGHYVLHKASDDPFYAHRDSDKRGTEKELEADYFSRSLLMPLKNFTSYYNELMDISDNDNDFTINTLSMIFKVTRNKINKRIEDLEILNG